MSEVPIDTEGVDATTDPAVIAAKIEELAKLDPILYGQRRKAEADKLGVLVSILDDQVKKWRQANRAGRNGPTVAFEDPVPWPEPVDGAELLDGLCRAFRRFLAIPDGTAEAMALWTLHAHAHDVAYVSPFLVFSSPMKRCGKTTALLMIYRLVPRPAMASSITPAVLFRVIDRYQPTILIDEAETVIADNDELRGLLNAGHTRATAVVWRNVPQGDGYEAQPFSTWAPKAIALIGRMRDTLEDRSIIVPMRRRRKDERVEKFRVDRDLGLSELAQRCARWTADNMTALKGHDPVVPDELHDRAADNWRPLLNIADLAGAEWPATGRRVALLLTGEDQDEGSAKTTLLADIRAIFADRGVDRIASSDLCDVLAKMEDRPWPEWKKGRPITTRQLAVLLKGFGITPGTIRLPDGGTAKGYLLSACDDVFARYLAIRSVTPSQPAENCEKSANSIRHKEADVTDRNSPKVAVSLGCDGVTDRNLEIPDEKVIDL